MPSERFMFINSQHFIIFFRTKYIYLIANLYQIFLQDGFGFHIGENVKKPQELRVQIGDDVEIGSNTTIDRGSWRDTVINSNTKLDNLIQIGHNVIIGEDCLICAQSGIAGSTTIGNGVLIGGQVGIAQHLNIGDDVRIAAKSGVMHDLQKGKAYGGYPAVEVNKFHRQTLFLKSSVSIYLAIN